MDAKVRYADKAAVGFGTTLMLLTVREHLCSPISGEKAVTYFNAGILGLLTYSLTAASLYGGPLQALGLLTFWRDRLGLAYWPALILIAMLLAIFLTQFVARFGLPRVALPAVFIAISMTFSALMVGTYADSRRSSVVEAFEPDVEIRASIFESFKNAPRDFQFFLHGAALKDCKPYAWSYGQMTFYELPSNVAVNELPISWIEECNIQRTR